MEEMGKERRTGDGKTFVLGNPTPNGGHRLWGFWFCTQKGRVITAAIQDLPEEGEDQSKKMGKAFWRPERTPTNVGVRGGE